jgi:hypothetical protein
MGAFICAAEQQRPILTSVAPQFAKSYLEFVEPLGMLLTVDAATLEAWADEMRS